MTVGAAVATGADRRYTLQTCPTGGYHLEEGA
jgi:hypothetical protein